MIERKSSRRDVHVPEMAEYKKPVTPTDVNVSTTSGQSRVLEITRVIASSNNFKYKFKNSPVFAFLWW